MQLDPLHTVLLALVSAIISGVSVKLFLGRRCVTHAELESVRIDLLKRCETQHSACGVHTLSQKLDALTDLVRLLCEHSGIGVKTQLEIEKQQAGTGRFK